MEDFIDYDAGTIDADDRKFAEEQKVYIISVPVPLSLGLEKLMELQLLVEEFVRKTIS
jgi:hypothetical protein